MKIVKVILFTLLIFVSLAFGYTPDGWWKFLPSTVAIIWVTWIFYREDWSVRLGFVGSLQLWVSCLILLPIFYFASHFCVEYALQDTQYMAVSGGFWDYLTNLPQTLNEEMIFRGLLLSGLTGFGIKKWPAIFGPAIIFAFSHWFFYQFNMMPLNRGSLEWTTMGTLLFFGIAMNTLFIATRSIAIPWVIHYGWNMNRFSARIVTVAAPESRIPEFESFNVLEGSYSVLALSFVLCLASLGILRLMQKKRLSKHQSSVC